MSNTNYTESFFNSMYTDEIMSTMANVNGHVIMPKTLEGIVNHWKITFVENEKYDTISRNRNDKSLEDRATHVLNIIKNAPIGAMLRNIRTGSDSLLKGEHMITEFKKIGVNTWKPRSFFMMVD